MKLQYKLGIVLAFALSFAATHVFAQKFEIDRTHSYVGFSVKHMVISTVKGRFADFAGTIEYNPDEVSKSSVNVAIQSASITTDSERRDNHLRSDDFFNAEEFPQITFVSKAIVKKEDGLVLVGDLTLRDVTREVELPFAIAGMIDNPRGGKRMGADASLTINRHDYGVKWSKSLDSGGLVVSDDVAIEIHIEAIHRNTAGESD